MQESFKDHGKEVPGMNPKTALSMDYCNQFNGLVSLFSDSGIEEVKSTLKSISLHVEQYEKVYAGCKDVVNDKNRDKVRRLDELANKMNQILKDPNSINEEDFRKTCNELNFLIYGDHDRDI
jgi:pyridoxine 5'-phosphate synthase PdxJ